MNIPKWEVYQRRQYANRSFGAWQLIGVIYSRRLARILADSITARDFSIKTKVVHRRK